MGFFQDMIAVFKKRELVFIESYKEAVDVYTFVFEKEKDLSWKAGQHGLFSITHKKIKYPTKPFTIASAPSENVVRLTMKITENPSEFKKAMLELKKGMTIGMSGPLGSLNVNDERPTIFIAGGIGITPFRSIVKQIEAEGNSNKKPIHLLYMDSEKSYLFKDELDVNNASLSTTYLDSRDELHREIDKLSNLYQNNGQYMIAGPKSMVASISDYLQNKSISKKNIKKDAFDGY
ncbi:FAD-dependent oxidoreductase [Ureibacillus acetophenoni]|uniref:Ferredoxin-NADP reductase n=1 Tax=Ureibacillus acetophenoni TaxID=614649 RepID=A0A285UF93_9BACL|nr:FAD-dependent oxidoreductase [Ureibacillus acetophenoni]SOC40540.1 ferredoxin-NADP reductase [Ureibacillus acetophenoni]